MAVLKNSELETLQKINNILCLTNYEHAVFYESLTEETENRYCKIYQTYR